MVLLREIFQHVIGKWVCENLSLEILLWSDKKKDEKDLVLKMPAQVGEKKDELKRLKRKVNLAYFVAKTDILFRILRKILDLYMSIKMILRNL